MIGEYCRKPLNDNVYIIKARVVSCSIDLVMQYKSTRSVQLIVVFEENL